MCVTSLPIEVISSAQREGDKPREGVVTITLNSFPNAVGFIDWLGAAASFINTLANGCENSTVNLGIAQLDGSGGKIQVVLPPQPVAGKPQITLRI
jgi:hypothetical protein